MGFPRTQDAALDFDTYFAMSSEQRLAALMEQLSQRITPASQKDLQTIRERITNKHHEISEQRKHEPSIPEPTFMHELLTAFSTRVKTLKKVSDMQKKQIEANQKKQEQKQEQEQEKKQPTRPCQIRVHNGQISIIDEGADETISSKNTSKKEKKKKKKSYQRCVIC